MSKFDAFPLVGEYDTVVVGGGTAGFAAAAASAQNGAKPSCWRKRHFWAVPRLAGRSAS